MALLEGTDLANALYMLSTMRLLIVLIELYCVFLDTNYLDSVLRHDVTGLATRFSGSLLRSVFNHAMRTSLSLSKSSKGDR